MDANTKAHAIIAVAVVGYIVLTGFVLWVFKAGKAYREHQRSLRRRPEIL